MVQIHHSLQCDAPYSALPVRHFGMNSFLRLQSRPARVPAPLSAKQGRTLCAPKVWTQGGNASEFATNPRRCKH